ncbi:MAG TPA: hypothetical protein VL307_18465 [Chitinophagaceae bacterium]|nr:hypothetical protein [Chitinophagaceae bacterium]
MKKDEFYIGWMDKAPRAYAHRVKYFVGCLMVLVVIIAVVLSLAQKPFASGNFEFGKTTEVKGTYFNTPIPLLKARNGEDIFGKPCFISIPLIGYGKFGAEGAMAAAEKALGESLNGRQVAIRGTLLYNDGKLLMQVDTSDGNPVTSATAADPAAGPVLEAIGDQQLQGEIVDPKCFFGVMKPGEGKPHKDCAIRCILGGIPPVLKVQDDKGNNNYYLLLGENGEKMNQTVQPFVAAPVTVSARAVRYDDWIILYVKQNGIQPYSYLRAHFGESVASCTTACK